MSGTRDIHVNNITIDGTQTGGGGGGGAPTTSEYVLGATDGTLTNAAVNTDAYMGIDVTPASPNAMDDEFTGSSLDVKWTVGSVGSGITETLANSRLIWNWAAGGATGRWIEQAYTAPGSFILKATMTPGIAVNYLGMGLYFRDSSSGKIQIFQYVYNTGVSPQGWGLGVFNESSYNTYVSTAHSQNNSPTPLIWLKAYDDSTNFNFYASHDGIGWVLVYQASRTAYLATPDRIGIQSAPQASYASVYTYDYFRRVI